MKKILIAALLTLGFATVANACPAIGAYQDYNDKYFLVYQCTGQNPYDVQVSYTRWDIYVTLGF